MACDRSCLWPLWVACARPVDASLCARLCASVGCPWILRHPSGLYTTTCRLKHRTHQAWKAEQQPHRAHEPRAAPYDVGERRRRAATAGAGAGAVVSAVAAAAPLACPKRVGTPLHPKRNEKKLKRRKRSIRRAKNARRSTRASAHPALAVHQPEKQLLQKPKKRQSRLLNVLKKGSRRRKRRSYWRNNKELRWQQQPPRKRRL